MSIPPAFRAPELEPCTCGSPAHPRVHCPFILNFQSASLDLALADPEESVERALHLIAESVRTR